MEEWYPWQGG
jgi:hypothetical protein